MKINKEKIIAYIVIVIYLILVFLAPIALILVIYSVFNIPTSDLPFWMKWALLTK